MNAKKKFLIVWLLLMVALSFFLGHFWSYTVYTVYALEKAVALGIVPLFVFSKSLAIAGVSFLL